MDKIRINNYKVENPKINENLRIASISDIHSEVETLDRIYELLKKIRVDLICMPGDIIDHVNDNRNKALLEVLKKISSLAKTYISIGNHDIYEQGMEVKVNQEYNLDFFKELEKQSDCKVLKDSYESIRHDDNVVVNAINLPLTYYINDEDERVLNDVITSQNIHNDKDAFNILLTHSSNRLIYHNKLITIMAILNEMSLVLSGHNHGCLTPMFIQEKSKKHIGLVGPYNKLFMENGYGTYTDEQASLIINNGVTKIAKSSGLGTIRKPLNRVLIPDVDIINVKNGKEKTLTLKNRKIARM